MKTEQIEAFLGYLEFHLLSFVEETEQQVRDPDVIGDMYNRAYGILVDFEDAMETKMLLDHTTPLTSNKRN